MKLFGIINIGFGKKRSEGLRFNLGSVIYRLDGKGAVYFSGVGYGTRVFRKSCSWKKAQGALSIRPSSEPNPHIIISGMSGFGKSTLFKSMLKDMHNSGVSCIIFDAHNEHSSLILSLNGAVHESSDSGINIFSLDGASISERISEITGLLKRVYRLGYIQTTKLGECLWYTYRRYGARSGSDRTLVREPKVGDLLYEIGIFIKNAKSAGERNSLLHLRDRISLLNTPAFTSNSVTMSSLHTGLHSFSLSSIKGSEQQVIYIEELLRRLYSVMKDMPKDRGIRQYIMMDEAQFLISRSSSSSDMVTSFIEEGRKYGIGVIIVTHSSATLNRQIIANASTFITFYSREPSEVAFAAKVLSNDTDSEHAIRSKISALRKNEAIIISANERIPKVVSTAGLYFPTPQPISSWHLPQITRPTLIQNLTNGSNLNTDRINGLVSNGTLEKFEYKTDNGTETWVMQRRGNISLEHEVMAEKIADTLKKDGISCFIYNKSNGPDIVAYAKDGKAAIEYETGRKNLEETRAMLDSRKGLYKRIIVVVNEGSLETYRRALDSYEIIGASEIRNIPQRLNPTTGKADNI